MGIFDTFTDSQKRNAFKLKYFGSNRLLYSKRFWVFVALGYSIPCYFFLKNNNHEYALKLSTSRKVSRMTGSVARMTVPKFLRRHLYGWYSSVYAVHLDEIVDDIESFETFSKFFTRAIKPRPIDPQPLSIASPADSRILTFSEVSDDQVMIVKGIHYKLGELLTGIDSYQIRGDVLNSMKRNPNNKLYQIVLYLAPGDYHRFHSPVDVNIKTRNHIVGELLPVKEQYVKTHSGVYEKNERVSIFGDWAQGFMSMVFVGALNVGSIDLNFDPELTTNKKLPLPVQLTDIKIYTDEVGSPQSAAQASNMGLLGPNGKTGIVVKKGEEIGRFNLGSTIALVFEASPGFEWKIQPGEAVRYGQCIGLSK